MAYGHQSGLTFRLAASNIRVVVRLFRLFLIAFAALSLSGQSTAMAMAPLSTAASPMASMSTDMNCSEMPVAGSREKAPCKGMTLQCIAQMGCTAPAALEPTVFTAYEPRLYRPIHGSTLVSRLLGRSYGPLPDPPSILI
jgi:hypothetical protein